MSFFSFLSKFRRQPKPSRQSAFIPDRTILDTDPLEGYVNHAADITELRTASAQKVRAAAPASPEDGYARAQAPMVSHHPSGRRMLSSTMNPSNLSTFARRSTRRSKRYSAFRRPLSRPRPIVLSPVVESSIVETDLSLLPSLLNDSNADKSSTVTLHGSITSKVLASLLKSVSKLNKLVFDEAIIHSSPSSFSSLISSLGVESLSFLGCKFDDAQILSDKFFVENGQITELTVSTKDGSLQSFPLLTDRTLERWISLAIQPPCLLLHNVSTSITITGVENLVKSFLTTASPYDRLCCMFGRLNTTMDKVVDRLKQIPALKIHCVHDSFLVAISHTPRIELNLQTAGPLPSRPSADSTLDELPALRRAPALRRKFAPGFSTAAGITIPAPVPPPRYVRSSSMRAPESVMISKTGPLSRTRRTNKSKRRSTRGPKGKKTEKTSTSIIAFL
ncbi:hypothetical protein PRIPAC_70663 [Pristionchus pacificus]|uniref:Uncharacterized protein n=1 Tax=Pristionchus pacificus TaxID=54126 RepID=A0A454XVC1_PRIPA|nr:hypothetical protein PRIPAC_70663 [Pristionchus pacificus]|eukprot:PDM80581.1 hypothetical protein PRIPAC_35584 [Pristionchus pacificus]